MQTLRGDQFVWPKMCANITRWCRTCVSCHSSKIQQPITAPVSQIPASEGAFQQVHVNIVSPLPVSCGYSYLLTIVDRATMCPDAFPLMSITAQDCADASVGTHPCPDSSLYISMSTLALNYSHVTHHPYKLLPEN